MVGPTVQQSEYCETTLSLLLYRCKGFVQNKVDIGVLSMCLRKALLSVGDRGRRARDDEPGGLALGYSVLWAQVLGAMDENTNGF